MSRAAVLREVLALVLLVLGAGAVGVAAYAVDWRLGTALVGVLALAFGLYLASDRRS